MTLAAGPARPPSPGGRTRRARTSVAWAVVPARSVNRTRPAAWLVAGQRGAGRLSAGTAARTHNSLGLPRWDQVMACGRRLHPCVRTACRGACGLAGTGRGIRRTQRGTGGGAAAGGPACASARSAPGLARPRHFGAGRPRPSSRAHTGRGTASGVGRHLTPPPRGNTYHRSAPSRAERVQCQESGPPPADRGEGMEPPERCASHPSPLR